MVELMVTTTLLLLVLGLLTPGVIATMRTMSVADQRITDLGQAQLGLAAVTRSLRAATQLRDETPAFLEAAPDRVVLYTNVDDGTGTGEDRRDAPSLVTIEVVDAAEGRVLRETVRAGRYTEVANGVFEWAADTARPERQRVIARGIAAVDLTVAPYFRYHADNTADSALTAAELGEPNALRRIQSMTVELTVAGAPQRNAGQSQLRQQIRMPNIPDWEDSG